LNPWPAQGVELVPCAARVHNVDIEAARDLGMAVTRVPIYSPNAVAEACRALLLRPLNRHVQSARSTRVREHQFLPAGLWALISNGKTAGNCGNGQIGRIVAQNPARFSGMVVVAYDPLPRCGPGRFARASPMWIRSPCSHLSDVISLHVPLMPETITSNPRETNRLANGSRCDPGECQARGGLNRHRALNRRRLKNPDALVGVALDVYEEEEGVFFEDLSRRGVGRNDLLARMLTFPMC